MSSWKLDTAHATVDFAVKHMMVTTVRGRFTSFDLEVDFDESAPERSSVVARIDASSVDTGQEQRDGHLRSADFFDVATYPELVFRSTNIEHRRGDEYAITGDLTIKGETRPVVLTAEIGGVVPRMQGGRLAAFSAATKISRKDWGLTWNVALESGGWLVGDEIKIQIDLELVAIPEQVEHALAS